MISYGIIDVRYNMTIDVVKVTSVQTSSGNIKTSYDYDNPIATEVPCELRPIITPGIRGQSSGQEFGEDYKDISYIHIATPYKLEKNDRIMNLLGPDAVLFDGIYQVTGIIPIPDPFGILSEYEATAQHVTRV